MAARKVNRAPPPPTLQQQQQQESEFKACEMVSAICFEGEEAAEASLRNGRQSPQQQNGPSNYHHQPTSVRDPHESEQQQQQQQPQRLKRISYIPHKSTAPPPPPLQAHVQAQSSPSSYSASDQKPHQLSTDAEVTTSAQPRVVVHQTVYTRPKGMDLMMNPTAASGSNRLINPFAPSSQRPMSQPPMSRSSRASSAGNLSIASWKSTDSRKSNRDSGGGHTVKGRLANLFRRNNRKHEQPLPQEQLKKQQQPQGQEPDRLRRHSCAPQPQPPLTRKNLHTFSYTDAKIYNPNNSNVYIAPPVRGGKKGLAPQPPSAALVADEAVPTDEAAEAAADEADDAGRTQVWWDMRTMGAMHSNYNTDVLLVKNPDPAPDYETATTRF